MRKYISFLLLLISAYYVSAQTKIDGLYYNLDDESKTATVTYKASDMAKGDVVVPATVNYGDTYQVVSIGEAAFGYYCKNLTSVSIAEGITTIETYAFYDCTALTELTLPSTTTSIGKFAINGSGITKLTVLATTVPTIETKTFSGVAANITLYVPEGCKSKYEADANWKLFKEIIELKNDDQEEQKEPGDDSEKQKEPEEQAAIQTIGTSSNVIIVDNTLSVAGTNNIFVYDATGNFIGKGDKVIVPHFGIYFIKANNKVYKVFVK